MNLSLAEKTNVGILVIVEKKNELVDSHPLNHTHMSIHKKTIYKFIPIK